MIIDFHVHGKLSSSLKFYEKDFYEKIEEAKRSGLNAFALLEHSHAVNFLDGHEYLKNNYKYNDFFYDIDGFKILTGIEITTMTNGKVDIVIIGELDTIIEIKDRAEALKNGRKYIETHELFGLSDFSDVVMIFAHPFRVRDDLKGIAQIVFDKLDAVELNATDIFKKGERESRDALNKVSLATGLPITGGGDAHHSMQVGSIKNIFKTDFNSIKELKEMIRARSFTVEIADDLQVKARAASKIKRVIVDYMKIHNMDYPEV